MNRKQMYESSESKWRKAHKERHVYFSFLFLTPPKAQNPEYIQVH